MDIRVFGKGDFHNSFVLLTAKYDADCGVFLGKFDLAIKGVDIHQHLSKILVGEAAKFQVYEDIAAQKAIVEDEIHKEVFPIEGKALLSSFKQEPFSQFQQEVLQIVN